MEMGVGGTGDWKCEGVEVVLFCRGAPKQTLTEGGKDSSMLALWQRSVSASVGEVSSMPAGAFLLVLRRLTANPGLAESHSRLMCSRI